MMAHAENKETQAGGKADAATLGYKNTDRLCPLLL